MPLMDGYEFAATALRSIREFGVDEPPKFVAITGHVESDYIRRAIMSGMEQVFSKPVKSKTIAQLLLERNFNVIESPASDNQ